MNPATALAVVAVDELIRCGMAEAVVAPGSRSAPLALELYRRAAAGDLRLHVRIDERSAAFCALGLAKASRVPVAVVCTSGSAAAHLHGAVIEADESAVPLLLLTADRPPELRGTGAGQTIDQLKLYGTAVRWFCELGVPEAEATAGNGYWRSAVSRAWALASGSGGSVAGPVHLNLPLREPLVPGPGDVLPGPDPADWPAELAGRAGGGPWTRVGAGGAGGAGGLAAGGLAAGGLAAGGLAAGGLAAGGLAAGGLVAGGLVAGGPAAVRPGPVAEVDWTERGLVVCGDGDYETGPLLELAERAGWPVLAEPSANARRGPNAIAAYQYLLSSPEFVAEHRPDVLISAGRPGLSRGQLALLRAGGRLRHVVLAQGPGRWADPGRTATDVAASIRLSGSVAGAGSGADSGAGAHAGSGSGAGARAGSGAGAGAGSAAGAGSGPGLAGGWLESWLRADAAARAAVDAVLDASAEISEARLARDLAAGLPSGALLWVASSLPVRDLDQQALARDDLRILASRGASGIDGMISSAIGAALAHQAAGGGPAFALLGDLSVIHDAPGLFLGADEPRPDLCLIVANNDGGGIFSMLEQAAIPGPFERVFGTPHGARLKYLAAAAGVPYRLISTAGDLAEVLAGWPGDRSAGQARGSGPGLRLAESRTDRAAQTALRATLAKAALAAIAALP